MRVINAASYVENGELHYIFSLYVSDDLGFEAQVNMDDTEIVVHNNTVYDYTGGTGIPSVEDAHFYTVYGA